MGMVGSVLKIREGGLKRLSRFAEVSLQMTSKARIGSPCHFGLQAGLAEGSWLRVGVWGHSWLRVGVWALISTALVLAGF